VDDNYTKCKEGGETMKDDNFCSLIDFGTWLLDMISKITGCDCKKSNELI
jgi:hypothetical protein